MTYVLTVKGQLFFDVVMFCKNTFLAIIQHQNSGTEEQIVAILNIPIF